MLLKVIEKNLIIICQQKCRVLCI